MTNTQELQKVVDKAVRGHFVDEYKPVESKLEKVYKVDKQESETDTYQNYTGLTQFSETGQGQDISSDSPIQAYGTSLTPVKYAKIMTVTYELKKWAKNKKIVDGARALGRAAARTVETIAASTYNNAFDTSYTSLTNGKPLCSTQQTRADGGPAQSNASATGIPLTYDNWEVAMLAMEFQLDDRGQRIDVLGTKLLVPSHLKSTALTLTKSEKKPGGNNNDVNIYTLQEFTGGLVDVIIWSHLDSTGGGASNTAWFLLDSNTHRVTWQWADHPTVANDKSTGFRNMTTQYRGFFYASKGWKDWRGVWGSKGDGNAYTD